MRPVFLLCLLPLVACSDIARSQGEADTGPKTSKSFAIGQFTAVEAAGPDDVDVKAGPAFSVRAEGSAKVLDRLEISKEGDSLKIRRKNDSGFSWGGSDHGARIHVTLPRMTGASTTGSGNLTVDRVDGDTFTANATGSGDLTIAALTVRSATLAVTGSGSLKVAGTAGSGSLSLAGSGDIDSPRFRASSATVSVTGSGDVSAAVNGNATVNVAGSGDVTLTGGAKCTTAKTGSGDIDCR